MATDYTKLSNEQLAELIKSGDYDCFPVLAARLMPHIKSTALKWKNLLPETDDLISEGLIAVFKAIKSFDSGKSSFATFASLCIDRAIGSKAKAELSGKRIPGNMLVSIDEDMLSCESAEDAVIRKEDTDNLKKNINSSLSALERKVLALYLDGNSYSAIAEKLSVSAKSVDGALQRVRNKLKSKP